MASKDMTIKIGADQVMFSNISKSKDGYNSARVVAKVNEKEYMSVSYEWEGDSVPDFAMNLMSFMQANEMGSGVNSLGDEYAEFAAKSKKPPFWKKDDEEEEEDPKKKKDKKDKKDPKKDKKKEKSDDAVAAKKACGGCGKEEHSCNCEGGFKPEKMAKKEKSDTEEE